MRPIFFIMESFGKYYERENLLDLRRGIASYIEGNTYVKDYPSGYVICEGLNHAVSPRLLDAASKVIAGLYLSALPIDLRPTMVIGVPNRGRELAVAIGMETGLTIGVTERTETNGNGNKSLNATYDQEQDMVIIRGISSFTKPGKVFDHTMRGVKPGSTILVADDFTAWGHATDQYEKGLHELGIKAIYVYLAAKHFPFLSPPQIGYWKHTQNNHNVFATSLITNMVGGTGGTVVANAEDRF